MPENVNSPEVVALTVQLLSAYLANNTVASEDLAGLIRSTRTVLAEDAVPAVVEPEVVVHTPAVSVRKSLASADHIISLIDGKRYKTLKRHLSAHGLTPESYRERYNLPASYPMVAPSFAAVRRKIAEQIGLGGRKKPAKAVAAVSSPSTGETSAKAPAAAKPKAAPRKAKVATKVKTVAAASLPATDGAASAAKAPAAKPAPAARKAKAKPVPAAKSKAAAGKGDVASVKPANGGAAPAVAKPAAEAPKRRGKLGLFKAGNGDAAKSAENASAAAAEPAKVAASTQPGASANGKKPATRRTARPPATNPA